MNDEEMDEDRARHLNAILSSDTQLKVVVAGPGTGKTFTFGRVLDQTQGPALVLSFLGNLVRDLDHDLGDRATVRTFHRYSRSLLHSLDIPGITHDVDYLPRFAAVLEFDIHLIRDGIPDGAVEAAFMNLDHSAGVPASAIQIGDYYNAVGHTDAVYRVFATLDAHPESIPQFAQILVDEYQDFSRLEVSLIDRLATVSRTLIAGDDDQALYGFKHATADYLRDILNGGQYARFELPYCTRCTQVLVAATHRVVHCAQAMGLLGERLAKQYICFLPKKRAASEAYPAIRHARCTVERNTAPYMCRYVAQQIAQISAEDIALSYAEGNPTVLVIAPSQFARRIHQHLIEHHFANVEYATRTRNDVPILDGYRRLVSNAQSRLGWRLVLEATQPAGWEDWVREALLDGTELATLVPDEFKNLHLAIVEILRALVADGSVDDETSQQLAAAIGLPMTEIRQLLGLDPAAEDDPVDESFPRVVVTNLQGSKGLQAEHVFIVGMNNGHFPRDNGHPSEDEVCQLLVALTRAKQSCTVVSCQRFGNQTVAPSVFLNWLAPQLQLTQVNAAYWNQ